MLIIYLTFTELGWNDLMESFVVESLERNVKHIVKRFPELDTSEPNAEYNNNITILL